MLPVANRKTLEVPHGLAALAAVICLVLSFVTDHSAIDQNAHAEQSGPTMPVEQVADESGVLPAPQSTGSRERRERPGNLTLLPWLPAPGGGR